MTIDKNGDFNVLMLSSSLSRYEKELSRLCPEILDPLI